MTSGCWFDHKLCMFPGLGNHEFDDGLTGLTPYLNNVNHQQLCTNIDFGPLATNITDKCLSSVIREIDGHLVGIMGYTTTETPVSWDTNFLFDL